MKEEEHRDQAAVAFLLMHLVSLLVIAGCGKYRFHSIVV